MNCSMHDFVPFFISSKELFPLSVVHSHRTLFSFSSISVLFINLMGDINVGLKKHIKDGIHVIVLFFQNFDAMTM